jgi:hypothetical protein
MLVCHSEGILFHENSYANINVYIVITKKILPE